MWNDNEIDDVGKWSETESAEKFHDKKRQTSRRYEYSSLEQQYV